MATSPNKRKHAEESAAESSVAASPSKRPCTDESDSSSSSDDDEPQWDEMDTVARRTLVRMVCGRNVASLMTEADIRGMPLKRMINVPAVQAFAAVHHAECNRRAEERQAKEKAKQDAYIARVTEVLQRYCGPVKDVVSKHDLDSSRSDGCADVYIKFLVEYTHAGSGSRRHIQLDHTYTIYADEDGGVRYMNASDVARTDMFEGAADAKNQLRALVWDLLLVYGVNPGAGKHIVIDPFDPWESEDEIDDSDDE